MCEIFDSKIKKWEIKQKTFEIFYLRESRVGHFFDKLLTPIVINISRQLKEQPS